LFQIYLEFLRFVPSTLCFILNGMLARMIFKKKNKDLGTYRYALLTFVISDILNGFMHLVVMPIAETYKNAFVQGGHSWWRTRTAVCFCLGIFSLTFPILLFNFLYRLVAV
ncbi:hypothetical protein PMAYCL1PPCAC_09169, partial [Pristionchus mayeri]